ncbi:MAG: ABC-type transport auxiliary lipoprotein family protein [Bacteroidota bacterium]
MKRYFIFALVIPMLFTTCRSGKSAVEKYMTLEFPTEREFSDSLSILPYSAEIKDVEIYPALQTHQIAIREKTHQLRYFVNNQWAVRLDKALTQYLLDYYQRNPLFELTANRYWTTSPDFQISTFVYNIEVREEKKDFLAYLHVDFKLIDTESKEVITTHTAQNTRLLSKRDLNLFASAINDMFFEELHYFAQKGWFELSDNKNR